ncbi:MAG: acyl-CoA dehydrogenase family protein [Reyranella sp.]|jgi:alkylation response protein AidB-like acyl-CoA dehydrogenase
MRFALTEEQALFGRSLRGFLADRLPVDNLRRLAEPGAGFDADLWRGLGELGLHGLLVPEEDGGAGLGMLDAALAAEALGYYAAPTPFTAALVMAVKAFRVAADTGQQRTWLPRIAAGEVRIAVGFAGLAGQTGRVALRLEGGRLSGALDGLLDAGGATHFLTYLPDGRAALLEAGAPGIATTLRRSVDRTRALVDVDLAGVAPVALLDAANDPLVAARRVRDAGRVMLAADTLGAAQNMLDRAVAYANERVQFGRVIGGFQGVKYMCADMATMLEPCRSLVWYAAYAQDALPEEAAAAANHAKAHLGEVGREVARIATEVHGGMGFTDLVGLHFQFKRITFDRHVLGGPERCRHDAAVAQGWIAA